MRKNGTCCIIALAGLLCGRAATVEAGGRAEPQKDFTIWIVSDIHYLAEGLHDDGPRWERLLAGGDNKNLAMVRPLLDALERNAETAAEAPDCLIVTGDLSLNGERESHLELAERFAAFEESGIPVYVLPGNHDTENPQACRFAGDGIVGVDTVTSEQFARIYGAFGFDNAVDRDEETLSYLAEPRPGIRLLMLDSTCCGGNLAAGYSEIGGTIPDSTRTWIAGCAARAAKDGAYLVAAMHHSLLDHNPIINEGYTVEDSENLAAFLRGLGIRCVLTGHTHIQDIAEAETANGAIYDITTNALSTFPHNYGILRVEGVGCTPSAEYRSARVDVAAWARETGSEDPKLIDFARISEEFSRARSVRMMSSLLAYEYEENPDIGELPDASVDRLLELLAKINTRFFAGREDLNEADDQATDDALIALIPDGFLSSYVESIRRDRGPSDNDLRLQ